MTLQNFILEQDINTVGLADIEFEQALAEYNVMSTIMECYQKQTILMENSDSDITEFNVFQESGEGVKEKAGKAKNAITGFFKTIWQLIVKTFRLVISKFVDIDKVIDMCDDYDESTVVKFETVVNMEVFQVAPKFVRSLRKMIEHGVTDPNEYKQAYDELKKAVSEGKGAHVSELTIGKLKSNLSTIRSRQILGEYQSISKDLDNAKSNLNDEALAALQPCEKYINKCVTFLVKELTNYSNQYKVAAKQVLKKQSTGNGKYDKFKNRKADKEAEALDRAYGRSDSQLENVLPKYMGDDDDEEE